MNKEILTATTIPEHERNDFLPQLFGASKLMVADRLFQGLVRSMAEEFKGGLWLYRRTSNDGLYMAPAAPERLTITVVDNYFEREVSSDAAGIILTLTAIGRLMQDEEEADEVLEVLHKRYYALRDYASTLPERENILAAID